MHLEAATDDREAVLHSRACRALPERNEDGGTLRDFLAIPDAIRRHELIQGVIVEKAQPSAEHGTAQRKLGAFVDPFDRRPGGRSPGAGGS